MLLYITWNSFIDFLDKGFAQNVVVTVLAAGFGYFISWYLRNTFFLLAHIRRLQYIFIKKKYILVWNDHKIETSEKLVQLFKEKKLNYHFKCLKNPIELLKFPLNPKYIEVVFLLVTDVTKLSDSEAKRKHIQNKIINYVRKGGTLFATHDIVYRRCRNEDLQEAFGCQSNNFQRFSTPINAEVIPEFRNHPLLNDIENSFYVDDGEVCYGEWDTDAKILVQTKEKYDFANKINIPLLVIRHIGNVGTLIWFNSGDKSDELARSLNEPQKEVLTIMYNAIKHLKEIKDYYRLSVGTLTVDGDNKTATNKGIAASGA